MTQWEALKLVEPFVGLYSKGSKKDTFAILGDPYFEKHPPYNDNTTRQITSTQRISVVDIVRLACEGWFLVQMNLLIGLVVWGLEPLVLVDKWETTQPPHLQTTQANHP